MMKYAVVIFWVCYIPQVVYSQIPQDMVMIDLQSKLIEKDLPKAAVKGSYYYNEGFDKASITHQEGTVYENVLARYNLKDDIFEVDFSKNIFLLKGEQTTSYQQGGEYFIRGHEISTSSSVRDVYYRVLHQGDMSLYVGTVVTFVPNNYNALMDIGSRSDEYLQEQEYLLIDHEGTIYITNSVRKMIKQIKHLEPSVGQFIKKNKLGTSEEDLELLLMIVNQ